MEWSIGVESWSEALEQISEWNRKLKSEDTIYLGANGASAKRVTIA